MLLTDPYLFIPEQYPNLALGKLILVDSGIGSVTYPSSQYQAILTGLDSVRNLPFLLICLFL